MLHSQLPRQHAVYLQAPQAEDLGVGFSKDRRRYANMWLRETLKLMVYSTRRVLPPAGGGRNYFKGRLADAFALGGRFVGRPSALPRTYRV